MSESPEHLALQRRSGRRGRGEGQLRCSPRAVRARREEADAPEQGDGLAVEGRNHEPAVVRPGTSPALAEEDLDDELAREGQAGGRALGGGERRRSEGRVLKAARAEKRRVRGQPRSRCRAVAAADRGGGTHEVAARAERPAVLLLTCRPAGDEQKVRAVPLGRPGRKVGRLPALEVALGEERPLRAGDLLFRLASCRCRARPDRLADVGPSAIDRDVVGRARERELKVDPVADRQGLGADLEPLWARPGQVIADFILEREV